MIDLTKALTLILLAILVLVLNKLFQRVETRAQKIMRETEQLSRTRKPVSRSLLLRDAVAKL
jgi:hypothetical protein